MRVDGRRRTSKQSCIDGIMHCPICGKTFYYNPNSIYKIQKTGLYYCGYNCYRTAGGGWDKEKTNINHW